MEEIIAHTLNFPQTDNCYTNNKYPLSPAQCWLGGGGGVGGGGEGGGRGVMGVWETADFFRFSVKFVKKMLKFSKCPKP